VASEPERLYWDTNLFLYHLNTNNDKGYLPFLDDMLAQATRGGVQIVTLVVTMTEVAFIDADFANNRAFASEAEIDRMWKMYPAILPLPLTEEVAVAARAIKRWQVKNRIRISKDLTMMDILHLGAAVDAGASRIYTAEDEWDILAPAVNIEIRRPDAHPMQLDLLRQQPDNA
jgi:predicted nucleic acid-binding protein